MLQISVIVPVYNVEDYIDICLDSIISQTFSDFEVICINDGSKDRSAKILEQYAKFDKRLKIITTENKGLSAARNKGLEAAKGQYITFVDSDDWISHIMLEKLYCNITENKSDYVFCNITQTVPEIDYFACWDFMPKDKFNSQVTGCCFCDDDVSPEIYFGMHTTAYAKLYRHDFIKKFRFPEGLIFEDIPFAANCFLSAKKISFDLEPYYFYRMKREGSIIQKANRKFLDIFEIRKIHENIFKEHNKFEKYKHHLLLMYMKDIFHKLLDTNGEVRKELFNLAKQTFSQIDYSKYNQEILRSDKIFMFYQALLKIDYKEFELLLNNNIKETKNV